MSRRVLLLTGLLLAGVVTLFVTAAVDSDGSGDDDGESERTSEADERRAAERRALLAYEEAIDPIAKEGGRIVVQGLRPAITDIREGAFSDEQLATMSGGQLAEMEGVRRDFLAVNTPPFLREARELFEEALDGYVATAEKLLAAAQATGDERQALVDQVADLGEAADDLYDRARAVIDRERKRLGLDPKETLPVTNPGQTRGS